MKPHDDNAASRALAECSCVFTCIILLSRYKIAGADGVCMRQRVVFPLLIAMAIILAGCGASGGSGASVSAPVPFQVGAANPNQPGAALGNFELDTKQTFSLIANAPATWSVGFCENGSDGCGTLNTSSGTTVTYTPPQTLMGGAPFQVVISAVNNGSDPNVLPGQFSVDPIIAAVPIVAISNPSSAIQAGTSAITLGVTIPNDVLHEGATWSLSGPSCSASGNPCGTLTVNATDNETATYAPPAEAPSDPEATITATSVEDPAQSNQFTFTISPASTVIILSDTFNTVSAGGASQILLATVKHDVGGQGVTWTLTAGSPPVACQPTCGSLGQPTSSTTGLVTTATITYTPPPGPALPPAPENAPIITATSAYAPTVTASDLFAVQDFTCGSGSESKLNGEYAFLLQGFNNGVPFALAGSIGADGTGKITGGEEDLNDYASYQHISLSVANSKYSVGADGRGCLTIASAGGPSVSYRLVLGGTTGTAAPKGYIIESDDVTGTGSRATGVLRLQNPASFNVNNVRSNYVIGVDGWDNGYGYPGHFAMAASCTVNDQSSPNGLADINDVVFLYSQWNISGCEFDAISTLTGRATGRIDKLPVGRMLPPYIGGALVLYMIDADEFFVISPSVPSVSGPLFSGRAISTSTSFSNSSVSGNYVFHYTGIYTNATNPQFVGRPALGLLTFANGSISGTAYAYFDGILSSALGLNFGPTYSVNSTFSRLSLGAFTDDAVYLTNPIDGVSGIYIDTGTSAGLGLVEQQPAATYGTSALAGRYYIGQDEPNQPIFTNAIGTAALSSTGIATGTTDESSATGVMPNGPFSLNLTINPDGTGDVGANTFAITNGSRVFVLQGSSYSNQLTVLDQE